MKTIIILSTLFVLSLGIAAGQTINWKSFQENQKHMISINTGWDYAATLGMGYARKLNTNMPVTINAEFSLPAGQNLADDLKAKFGGQVRAYQSGNFVAAISILGIFRQYRSDFVKMQNYGGEFTGTAGYYKSKWFAAGEIGFDKAIATRIINSELMKQYYPVVRDGWYVPTGGNFYYGIRAGYSLKFMDITLRAGQTTDQYFKKTATVPLYAQLGLNVRL